MSNGEYTLRERRERIGKMFSSDCMQCGKRFSYVSILGGSQKLCSTCKADFLESMIHRTVVSTDTYVADTYHVQRRIPFNADKLRVWLKDNKMSQSKLAKSIGEANSQTISKDLQVRKATPERIKLYAGVMGINEADLRSVDDD